MYPSLVLLSFLPSAAISFPHFAISRSNLKLAYRQAYETSNDTLKPNHFIWSPPGPGDVRSPCPTLNTLSNHGFLPHDGRNVTLDILTTGLKDGMNIGPGIAQEAFGRAVQANPIFNASYFDLDMMHVHNFIEHDGSLSRKDAVFDKTNSFDEKTFNSFLSYFGNETVMTIESTANARARHALDMSKKNPGFSITWGQIPVILGENAMMLSVWNKGTEGTQENPIANRAFYEFFFRNQKLPVEIGWTPVEIEVGEFTGTIIEKLRAVSPSDVPLAFNPGLLK